MHAQPITASTPQGQAVVSHFYRLLEGVAARDQPGSALLEKYRTQGYLLNRAVAQVEAYVEQQISLQPQGRSRRRRAADLRRWSSSLLSLLTPWVSGDGPEQAKKAAAARRTAEDRNASIAATAKKLLQLMERNAGAMLSEMKPGVPYAPIDVQLPRLRRDLHRLVDITTGARRLRRREADAKARKKDGLSPQTTWSPLAYGAQGFISEVDRALPFLAKPQTLIDLWHFVSEQEEPIAEATVRAARKPERNRTSSG